MDSVALLNGISTYQPLSVGLKSHLKDSSGTDKALAEGYKGVHAFYEVVSWKVSESGRLELELVNYDAVVVRFISHYVTRCSQCILQTEFESHWVPLSYGLVPHLSKKLSKFPVYSTDSANWASVIYIAYRKMQRISRLFKPEKYLYKTTVDLYDRD